MVDGLSRIWTTEARLDKTGKVSHLAACIVRVPFKVGRIVSPADIMEVIQNSTEPLVFAADSPTITKATQTDMPEFGGNNLLEPLPTTIWISGSCFFLQVPLKSMEGKICV